MFCCILVSTLRHWLRSISVNVANIFYWLVRHIWLELELVLHLEMKKWSKKLKMKALWGSRSCLPSSSLDLSKHFLIWVWTAAYVKSRRVAISSTRKGICALSMVSASKPAYLAILLFYELVCVKRILSDFSMETSLFWCLCWLWNVCEEKGIRILDVLYSVPTYSVACNIFLSWLECLITVSFLYVPCFFHDNFCLCIRIWYQFCISCCLSWSGKGQRISGGHQVAVACKQPCRIYNDSAYTSNLLWCKSTIRLPGKTFYWLF